MPKLVWLLLLGLFLQGMPLQAQEETSQPALPHTICQSDSFAALYHMEQGGLARGRQRWEEAIQHYDCALALEPNAAYAYRGRGLAQLALNRLQLALTDFHLANDLRPDDPVTLNNLGVVMLRLKQPFHAIEFFNQAIALDPEYGLAFSNRGLGQQMGGNIAAAIEDFAHAAELGSTPAYEPYMHLAEIYVEQENLVEAIFWYERAVAAAPDYADGFKRLGDLYLKMENIGAAEEKYTRYVALVNRASEDVLGIVTQAALRSLLERYLPSIVIVLIGLYFAGRIFLQWRARRKASAPALPKPVAEPRAPLPAVAQAASVMPSTSTETAPATRGRVRGLLLALPLMLGALIVAALRLRSSEA